MYAKDCNELVGEMVDHRPALLVQSQVEMSKGYWKGKYGDVPFEVD